MHFYNDHASWLFFMAFIIAFSSPATRHFAYYTKIQQTSSANRALLCEFCIILLTNPPYHVTLSTYDIVCNWEAGINYA